MVETFIFSNTEDGLSGLCQLSAKPSSKRLITKYQVTQKVWKQDTFTLLICRIIHCYILYLPVPPSNFPQFLFTTQASFLCLLFLLSLDWKAEKDLNRSPSPSWWVSVNQPASLGHFFSLYLLFLKTASSFSTLASNFTALPSIKKLSITCLHTSKNTEKRAFKKFSIQRHT